MEIKFNNFSSGIHNFEFIEKVENLELDEGFSGDLVVNCKMDKSSHQIVLFCDVNVKGNFECDRCTVEYEQDLNNTFEVVYIFSESGEEKNDEENINVHYISSDADKISIREEVIDFTLLAVPFKKLCAEDCKGLCPKCGNDLNTEECKCEKDTTNPVWEPLMKLKDKLN